MKLALVYLIFFVAMSYQQQFQKKFYWAPVNQQDQSFRFQHYQYPSEGINDQEIEPTMVVSASDFPQPWFDQHFYQRRKTQYTNSEASPNISPLFWYMDPGMVDRQGLLLRNYLNAFNSQSFEDDEEPIKSRRRYPSIAIDPAQERLFGLLSGSFGGSPFASNTSTARPFFGAFFTKTFVSVTTLLLNTTSTPLCIASNAVNAAVPCKRRRRGMKIPLDLYIQDDVASLISPSSIEKYDMTASISSDFAFYKEKNVKLDQFLLESSKEDVVVVGSDHEQDKDNDQRDKRQFVVSTTTTLTSYLISTVLAVTKSVVLSTAGGAVVAAGTSLNCLPPGLKVCP